MVDFARVVKTRLGKESSIYQLSLDFNVGRVRDLITRGGQFCGFYNENTGFWEPRRNFYRYAYDALMAEQEVQKVTNPEQTFVVQNPEHLSSKIPQKIDSLVSAQDDDPILFNQKVVFKSQELKREDYATFKMPYDLPETDKCDGYDTLMSVLYSPEDRTMLEWLAGAALCGDGDKVEKFVYLEGEPGSGKSTFLNILMEVAGPYGASIKAEQFANSSDSFATSQIKDGPLIGIQHDGDLSKIETNTTLNNIVSHEPIMINDKYAKRYYTKTKTLLFIASNEPLRLTSSMSGLLRRVLDPVPTGKTLPREKYDIARNMASREIAGIAQRFINVYKELGRKAYDKYRSTRIVRSGNALGYWVQRTRDIAWASSDEALLSEEYALYRAFCDANSLKSISKCAFERQIGFFWNEKSEEESANGTKDVRYFGYGWKTNKFVLPVYSKYQIDEECGEEVDIENWLNFESKSDEPFYSICKDMPAQYAKEGGSPRVKWISVETKLLNIVSTELHYVKVPQNHIVIDLDLRNETGSKDLAINIAKVKELGLPPTYGELSKSGQGIHLHYNYTGDTSKLMNLIEEGVEIKVFNGDAALRRKFSYSNGLPVETISSGLPEKVSKENAAKEITDAKHLKNFIRKGLRGEFGSHVVTIDFIAYVLEECYNSNKFPYNLDYMRADISAYGARSTHNATHCIDVAKTMKLISKGYVDERPLVFFDMEVFSNYNCLVWKIYRSGKKNKERFPSAAFLSSFFKNYKVVGFNNKAYDNDIAWTIMKGATPEEVFQRSQQLIKSKERVKIPWEAINLSYTDMHDVLNDKRSLKKWEIAMGIAHVECRHPFDEPLPEEYWDEVDEYCEYDVDATEALWDFPPFKKDWAARKSLVYMCGEGSGMTVNSSTNQLTAKILFGNDRFPREQFVYTDLSKEFPGYMYEIDDSGKCVSRYMGEDPSNGGWVKAMPGYYVCVGCDDVASLHPSSAIALNIFGTTYTTRYRDLVYARKACKHPDTAPEKLSNNQFGPILMEMVENGITTYKELSGSLKTPINAVYGQTSAKNNNPFKDPRNVDNIVAKRGALMMITLYNEVLKQGWTPVHIKTDSIKLPNFTKEMHEFIVQFGKKYGYDFEIEEFYSVFCLINKAEYIAYNVKTQSWESRGTTYSGYTLKKLFTHEEIVSRDFAITKESNKGSIYIGDEFVGKNVNIVCVKDGASMKVVSTDGSETKSGAVSGTKGYLWMEYEELMTHEDWEDRINYDYYDGLVADAKAELEKYVPYEVFVQNATAYEMPFDM